jgi:hypothetical protein
LPNVAGGSNKDIIPLKISLDMHMFQGKPLGQSVDCIVNHLTRTHHLRILSFLVEADGQPGYVRQPRQFGLCDGDKLSRSIRKYFTPKQEQRTGHCRKRIIDLMCDHCDHLTCARQPRALKFHLLSLHLIRNIS